MSATVPAFSSNNPFRRSSATSTSSVQSRPQPINNNRLNNNDLLGFDFNQQPSSSSSLPSSNNDNRLPHSFSTHSVNSNNDQVYSRPKPKHLSNIYSNSRYSSSDQSLFYSSSSPSAIIDSYQNLTPTDSINSRNNKPPINSFMSYSSSDSNSSLP